MNILISGAGPAGLTAAYWLKHYGFNPTIVEQASSLPKGGYKIDVRGAGVSILRKMGIYESIIKASTDMQGALLVDREGKVIDEMSGDAFGHRVSEDVEILRGNLCQILMDQISDIEFIFGDSILEITQLPGRVQIKFQKNSPREFDLLIGADGLHSNVRKLIFGEEDHFLHPLGLYLCVFTIPNYLNLDRIEMQYSELGRIATIWSSRGEDTAKACFGFNEPKSIHKNLHINLNDRKQQEQVLRNIYEGIHWEVPKLFDLMPKASDFYFDTAAQIHMDHWCNDRVALVGDAAYCASPMSGQGTSLALIGAYVLAGELFTVKGNYKNAFYQYEQQMRPFVKLNQKLGKQSAKRMKLKDENNLQAKFFKYLLEIVPRFLIKFFINLSTRRIQKAANSITLKVYDK